MKQEIIHYKPGIYRFEWPYLGGSLVPNDKGEVTVYKCDVELRVGQDEDIREGRLITVVVTSMLPQVLKIILNTLQLKFKIAFFDQIFIEKRWRSPLSLKTEFAGSNNTCTRNKTVAMLRMICFQK
ncbi:hypothetical protein H6F38_03315 [Paenibacillus sp. EKM208P]|nr:hypothetical protein H6F38_03315 [Paenibacillus sp. EKM208P]